MFILLLLAIFLGQYHGAVNGKSISRDDFEAIKNDPNRWRELYNYYDNIAVCDQSTINKVLEWGSHCILICDSAGRSRLLDRIKNRFNVGLGDQVFEDASIDGDEGPYNGDPCDPPQSVIPRNGTSDYIKICNEDGETEVLSMQFSACPSGAANNTAVPEAAAFQGNKQMTNEMDNVACLEMVLDQVKYLSKSKAIAPLISHCKSTNLDLQTKKEAPRLLVVQNADGTLSTCFVVGEGLSMEVGANIKEAFTTLMMAYYVLDLTYPKQYQLLGQRTCILTSEDDVDNIYSRLEHNKAWVSDTLDGEDGVCNVIYCCDGALFASRGEKCDEQAHCAEG